MEGLVIIGCGGFAREVAWLVEQINMRTPQWELVGFLEKAPAHLHDSSTGYRILREPDDLPSITPGTHFVCGIGDPAIRRATSLHALSRGWIPATLIHPSAIVGARVSVGAGSIIGPYAILAPDCCIGEHCVINIHASAGHDCRIGDYCVLSPGARVGGWAAVGEGCMLGTNASIAPRTKLGRGSRLAMNSAIFANTENDLTLLGVPARQFFPKPTT